MSRKKRQPLQDTTFFRLTPGVRDRLLEINLTAAEWRVWCYLVSLDPFGDRGAKFSPAELMLKCSIKKTTYFAAKAKFQKLGLFDFRDGVTKVVNLQTSSDKSDNSNYSQQAEIIESEISESHSEISESEFGDSESHSEISESEFGDSDNRSLKLMPSKTFEMLQTIQTYSDFKDSLSESERENFLKFVEEKTKNLEKPINDLEAWLASKNAAKQDRWEVYYERFKIEAKDNLAQIEKLAAKQKAIADFKNRCNLKKREDKFENQQNPVEPESNPTGEGRAIAEVTKLNNLPNEKIESKNPQNNGDQAEQTAEIPGETPGIASSTSEINRLEAKQRAIADFQQRMNVNRPIPEPEEIKRTSAGSEATSNPVSSSEEYQQKLAEVNRLLDDSPQSEKSLAQQHREKLAHAKQQQQELARQRREAAAKHSQQQEQDLQRRKEKMLREFEEFNQLDSQRQKSENE